MPTVRATTTRLLASLLLLTATPANAVTMKLQSTKTPKTGVVLKHYATTSPTTRLWVADIDLCAAQIHVDATRPPSSLQTTGSWATKVGALLATNGDFYKTGPVRVYGQAVGRGVPWPSKQTGADAAYKGQWYYGDYGWIATLHDDIQWSHSGYSKKNAAKLGLTTGWSPTKFSHAIPAGVLGLVSGFPQLVVEGKQVTCTSPTASSCFPDRSDMRARHPRTAMGLTADRKHLLLLVVDGRTSKSKGMYGAELAEVMKKLGAWQAFNIDGGGSSELWLAGTGYVNDVKGNNYGGGVRSVANHWGILVTDRPKRPGHCIASKPCGVIPAKGGVVDDAGACFVPFGPMKYWRSEKKGHDGGLRWTNATSGSVPSNWAWWRLNFAEAGKYTLEYRAEKQWAVHKKVQYQLRAGDKSTVMMIDQSKGGTWRSLGTHTFSQGGKQWLAIYDTNGSKVGSNQHIVADAIRLTRVGPWCGDATCNGSETCGSCAQDCGACPSCGDGKCNGKETCATCAKDCGACDKCGDGKCSGGETCGTCVQDCGECPAVDAGPTDVGSGDDAGAQPAGDGGFVVDSAADDDAWLPLPDDAWLPLPDDVTVGDANDGGRDVPVKPADDAQPGDGAMVAQDVDAAGSRPLIGNGSAANSGCSAGFRVPGSSWIGLLLALVSLLVLRGARGIAATPRVRDRDRARIR